MSQSKGVALLLGIVAILGVGVVPRPRSIFPGLTIPQRSVLVQSPNLMSVSQTLSDRAGAVTAKLGEGTVVVERTGGQTTDVTGDEVMVLPARTGAVGEEVNRPDVTTASNWK